MINNVTLMGRLTANPEVRATTNGKSVTSFAIAVERNYVKSGEKRQTDFINIVVWEKTAEFVERNFRKGQMIGIVGSIQQRSYEDKNGNKRTTMDIVADEVHFCGDKKECGAEQHTFTVATNDDFEEINNDDDDLPF